MMMTNVPQFLTQGALISLLEDLSTYMRGAFDFFYCPWDSYQDCNLGYAIINFFLRSVATEFEKQWADQPLLPRTHASKRLRIKPAALQGRAANLRHFSGFSLAHHKDPRFRPLVRAGPKDKLQPMALSEEIVDPDSRNMDQGVLAIEHDVQETVPLSETSPSVPPPSVSSTSLAGNAASAWPADVIAALAANNRMGLLAPSLDQVATMSFADSTARSNALMMLLANSRTETRVMGLGNPQLASMSGQSLQGMGMADGMPGLGQVMLMPGTGAADVSLPAEEAPMRNNAVPDVLAASYGLPLSSAGGAVPGLQSVANAMCVQMFPQALPGLGGQHAASQLQLRYLQQLEACGAYPDKGM